MKVLNTCLVSFSGNNKIAVNSYALTYLNNKLLLSDHYKPRNMPFVKYTKMNKI